MFAAFKIHPDFCVTEGLKSNSVNVNQEAQSGAPKAEHIFIKKRFPLGIIK